VTIFSKEGYDFRQVFSLHSLSPLALMGLVAVTGMVGMGQEPTILTVFKLKELS